MGILPILAFVLIFINLSRTLLHPKREVLLLSALVWGSFVVFSTEILGFFCQLNYFSIVFFWIGMIVILLGWFRAQGLGGKPFNFFNFSLSLSEKILLGIIGVVVSVVALIAFIAPPNNWDSMTYHMSRVVHWIQNQSVNHYATSNIRQLTYMPWAEYGILHFQILSGGDRFANFIQCFSFMGSVAGVTLLAKQFGLNRLGQIAAGVVAATIPMGILQASSTQNDLVVSFWLICEVSFLLRFLEAGSRFYALAIGASLGLSLLTKGTAYVYSTGFLVIFFVEAIRKYGARKAFASAFIVALIAIALNGSYYSRNYFLGGHLLTGSESPDLNNDIVTPAVVLSNILRNMALHLGTSSDAVNTGFENIVVKAHQFLSISPNDARTSFGGDFRIPSGLYEEDAPNFSHFLLIGFSILTTLFLKFSKKIKVPIDYFFVLLAAFLLFCTVLKWQPWHSRLHLPLFILFAPYVVFVLFQILDRRVITVFCVLLFLSSLPWLIRNQSRRIISSKRTIFNIPRENQYFENRLELIGPFKEAVEYIKKQNCKDIGLLLGADSWEYPYWVLLKAQNKGIAIQHVDVNNISAKYENKNFSPCLLISDSEKNREGYVLYGKGVFGLGWDSAYFYVLKKI